jgi:Zn-dependent oligopeptidase
VSYNWSGDRLTQVTDFMGNMWKYGEEVIINTIKNFEAILEEENKKSLEPKDIDYLSWTDF